MRLKTIRIIQITLGIFTVGSLLIIASGIANEIKLKKIRNQGVVVQAEILKSGELEEKQGRKTHYLRVKFQKENNEDEIKDFSVDRDDYEHALKLGRIPITYIPNNPGLSRVGQNVGFNYKRYPLYIALAFFFSSIFLITFLEYTFRKMKK